VVARADDHVARTRPRGLALASCVAAMHAFGAGERAFARAFERLLRPHAVSHLRLGPERVAAYERAWCDALAAWLVAHPGDPREAWARERIAWTDDEGLRAARAELAFDAWVVLGAGQRDAARASGA
jgi:hypothetical protein